MIDGDYIIYTRKADGIKEYLSYNKTLFEILTLTRVSPFRCNGRLQLCVWENGTRTKFYLYDLAYGCYTEQIHTNRFLKDIQRLYDYKSSHNLSIDHADSNIHNHTKYNLSCMDIRLNASKGSIVAYIKQPLYLNSVYCDGKYRVQVIFAVSPKQMSNTIFNRFTEGIKTECAGGFAAIHFLCNTADEYVRCLKWIAEQKYEWAAPIKNGTKWIDNKNPC